MAELIYLDYAATTPVDSAVAERMRAVQQEAFFNPASNHAGGWKSDAVVQAAAAALGGLLNTDPDRLLWTSGATESNNLAIFGIATQRAHRGKHVITMRTEHKAVVDVYRALQKRGFEVTWLEPEADGALDIEKLKDALRDDTQLVSIMHVNNEIGTINDIATIGTCCRERGVALHVDGAQAAGKIPVDLSLLPVDVYSITGHKFYGPKGIGALYVADDVVLQPMLFGGGQQRRLRPGTLPVELIAGLGEAANQAQRRLAGDLEHLTRLKRELWNGISNIEGLRVNGQLDDAYPGILNVGIHGDQGVNGESLLLALEPLCVATGSACNAQSQESSYVLRALGRSDAEAQSAIRFSFGRPTSSQDIARAVDLYSRAIERLRAIAPEYVR